MTFSGPRQPCLVPTVISSLRMLEDSGISGCPTMQTDGSQVTPLSTHLPFLEATCPPRMCPRKTKGRVNQPYRMNLVPGTTCIWDRDKSPQYCAFWMENCYPPSPCTHIIFLEWFCEASRSCFLPSKDILVHCVCGGGSAEWCVCYRVHVEVRG